MSGHFKKVLARGGHHELAQTAVKQAFRPRCRSMATHAALPSSELINDAQNSAPDAPPTPQNLGPIGPSTVLTTVYQFPTMEPLRFASYPANHLHLPLRRDILHRAVVYEGDNTRQGTASTKWRDEVHGSGRKVRPQKGTGKARLGDKKSPMLRGGGVAFGPKPRDFSTKLPLKMYDLAWRTALSYRYRRGQLIVVEDVKDLDVSNSDPELVRQMFEVNGWGKSQGRSLLVTESNLTRLYRAISLVGSEGRALERWDVDVKDLLELGRIIIEKRSLDAMLEEHQSDLVRTSQLVAPVIST